MDFTITVQVNVPNGSVAEVELSAVAERHTPDAERTWESMVASLFGPGATARILTVTPRD